MFRNYQSRAQVHVVVRRTNGDNLYDNDLIGAYGVDDDAVLTNNTLAAPQAEASGSSTKRTVSVSAADIGTGFLSPYHRGSAQWDNVEIYRW